MISSFEARSPFVYSIRIPTLSFALPRMTRNSHKAKGLRWHCTGAEEAEARVGGKGQTDYFRLRPGPCWPPLASLPLGSATCSHSKRCMNGTANSATTCRWQVDSARQRWTQQSPDASSNSQSVPTSKSIDYEPRRVGRIKSRVIVGFWRRQPSSVGNWHHIFQKNNLLIFDSPPSHCLRHTRGIKLLHLQIAYPFQAAKCEVGFFK